MEKTFQQQLRALADFYDAHPTLPTPILPIRFGVCVLTKDKLLGIMNELGECKKLYSDMYLTIWPAGQFIEFYTPKNEVCTVKRTEKVTVPASAEYTYDKVVEWECHPLLGPSER